MKNTPVTINFPTEELAKLFLGWLSDGGGEDYFYDVAEQEGVYINFDYTGEARTCLVSISGMVVDDDDPEMHGIFEDE